MARSSSAARALAEAFCTGESQDGARRFAGGAGRHGQF
jgi:hypothetical protein